MEGKYKLKNVIYEATIKTQKQEQFTYIGLTENPFFERLQKHNSSFRIHDPRNSTGLSKKVLELQGKHILSDSFWKIIQTASSYKPGAPDCRL